MTLVRNNIHACETAVHMEGAEYQMIRVKLNDTELHILNFYCPNDRPLSLDAIKVPDKSFVAVGDFNSHSQSWGYRQIDEETKWKTGKTTTTSPHQLSKRHPNLLFQTMAHYLHSRSCFLSPERWESS